ncbi:MAG: DNA-directed RNA polymerase subunit L [ANME-2 cluster archaeon]|nr:DNA-directed RNA polymerase subunit L [ANME-2 cluster archaeon]MCL7475992.1 DNA-directed RNA polymerase subunit L [ANME-2 cluster archaeon]MDF1531746.1 DNA-directed RNA polymerase subunit L [ANME-2 cluster archaeon]MDW7776646.1 DNA-directed RNA polymerase subunit L [Methanosarcinales archaeon]
MELKVIEKSDTEILIEIGGESHTLLNTLKSSLLDDPRVEVATYDIKHPTISEPVLFVKTNGVDPIVAITEASERLIQVYEEFKTVFNEKASI